MTTTSQTLPTQNPEWGFWGTLEAAGLGHALTDCAWQLASDQIARALPSADAEAIRAFLDSRHGRHFGDTVVNAWGPGGAHTMQEAVAFAVEQWQAVRLNKPEAKRLGIYPEALGVPRLDAIVTICGIEAEE